MLSLDSTRQLHIKYAETGNKDMMAPKTPENSKEDIRRALRQLAEAPAAPSNTRRIMAVLDEIEGSMAAGASYKEIRDTLAEHGYELSLRAFESALYRARRRKQKEDSRKGGGQTTQHPAQAQARRATPTVGPAPASAPVPRKRGPLELAPSPKKFEWDPLERPVIEFIDEAKPQGEDKEQPQPE